MNEFSSGPAGAQVEKEIELEVPESHKDLEGKRFFGLENVSRPWAVWGEVREGGPPGER